MAAADTLLRDVAARLRIAHHLPGRVRLKLEAELSAAQQRAIGEARQLLEALGGVPGIRTVKLNLLARSCTVEYDPTRIPPAAWEQLVAGTAGDAGAALRAKLATVLDGG